MRLYLLRDIGSGKKVVRASPHFFKSKEEIIKAVSYIKNVFEMIIIIVSYLYLLDPRSQSW
jgi:hypothetical protein